MRFELEFERVESVGDDERAAQSASGNGKFGGRTATMRVLEKADESEMGGLRVEMPSGREVSRVAWERHLPNLIEIEDAGALAVPVVFVFFSRRRRPCP